MSCLLSTKIYKKQNKAMLWWKKPYRSQNSFSPFVRQLTERARDIQHEESRYSIPVQSRKNVINGNQNSNKRSVKFSLDTGRQISSRSAPPPPLTVILKTRELPFPMPWVLSNPKCRPYHFPPSSQGIERCPWGQWMLVRSSWTCDTVKEPRSSSEWASANAL